MWFLAQNLNFQRTKAPLGFTIHAECHQYYWVKTLWGRILSNIFWYFGGQWIFKKNCFWDLLTFRFIIIFKLFLYSTTDIHMLVGNYTMVFTFFLHNLVNLVLCTGRCNPTQPNPYFDNFEVKIRFLIFQNEKTWAWDNAPMYLEMEKVLSPWNHN